MPKRQDNGRKAAPPTVSSGASDIEFAEKARSHAAGTNQSSTSSFKSSGIGGARSRNDHDQYRENVSASRNFITNAMVIDENDGDEQQEEHDVEMTNADEDDDEEELYQDRRASSDQRSDSGESDDHDGLDEDDEDEDEEDEDEDEHLDEPSEESDEEDEDEEDDMRNDLAAQRRLFGTLAGIGLAPPSGRIKSIVEAIKNKGDPSEVLVGLQELAEHLLMANEDMLLGYFPTKDVAKTLVDIMQSPIFEDSPEIMLQACRNISNLIEAIPAAVGPLVQAKVVSVLTNKLLEIQYIDLAEQALSTMEKISQEFPRAVVEEGGLTACLMYLDFFSSHVQRTALTTAANCCLQIPRDQIENVCEIIPTLENVLENPDQIVAEKAVACVCEIMDVIVFDEDRLERVMNSRLLHRLVSFIDPAGSRKVSQDIRLNIVDMLAKICEKSPALAALTVKEGSADVVYRMLTGLEPSVDHQTRRDNAAVIHALINANSNLILTSLTLISSVFPEVEPSADSNNVSPLRSAFKVADSEDRLRRLIENPDDLTKFCRVSASLMFDMFASSMNASMRYLVLAGFFKMISALDASVLSMVIKEEEMVTLISSIFSQSETSQSDNLLIVGGIEICKALLLKLPEDYGTRLYRLGVISELTTFSQGEAPDETERWKTEFDTLKRHLHIGRQNELDEADEEDNDEEIDEDSGDEDIDNESDEEDEDHRGAKEESSEDEMSDHHGFELVRHNLHIYREDKPLESFIILESASLVSLFRKSVGSKFEEEAGKSLLQLEKVAGQLRQGNNLHGTFEHFSSILHGVSSFELVKSGVLDALVECLVGDSSEVNRSRQRVFLEVMMRENDRSFGPFEMMVEKLHEALASVERFEVYTSGWQEGMTSRLASDIRICFEAIDPEDVSPSLRTVQVSVHAIATFSALNDFLSSKLRFAESISGGSNSGSNLESFLRQMQSHLRRELRAAAHHAAADALDEANGEEASEDPERERINLDQDGDTELASEQDATVIEPQADTGDNSDIPDNAIERQEAATSKHDEDEIPEAVDQTESIARRNNDEWHIEFYLNDEIVPYDSTVYGAIYKYLEKKQLASGDGAKNRQFATSIWRTTHRVKYKRVRGKRVPVIEQQRKAEADARERQVEELDAFRQTPASFGTGVQSTVIRLLTVLFTLNNTLEDIFGDIVIREGVSNTKFLSSKLTAKLNKQIDEPLLITSGTLPDWIVDATRLYPFLFPFESRLAFLQSTSFGYSRAMQRWDKREQAQSSGGARRERHMAPLGRAVRQKVRVSRRNIMQNAIRVMKMCGSSPNILELEFFDEVGSGLGPTLEFYASVSQEFAKKKFKLWRDTNPNVSSKYIEPNEGLFPVARSDNYLASKSGQKVLGLFDTLGVFIARAMIDSRIVDFNFSPLFFRALGPKVMALKPNLATLSLVDKQLAHSLGVLKGLVEQGTFDEANIALDFTMPGDANYELVADGANVRVTSANFAQYLQLVLNETLVNGISKQLKAFTDGFSKVYPYSAMHAFTPEELVSMCGQSEEDWTYTAIYNSIKADHGYTKDHSMIEQLVGILCEFTPDERRAFLQFMTGSPRLPIGGFNALNPAFTVVCKYPEAGLSPDQYLPSVMTCANYLKLPPYSSREILKLKLETAMKEGAGAFLLS